MILLAIVWVFAAIGAVLYVAIGPNPQSPSSARVQELARIVFAAAFFAICFSLTLGTHDAIVRVLK